MPDAGGHRYKQDWRAIEFGPGRRDFPPMLATVCGGLGEGTQEGAEAWPCLWTSLRQMLPSPPTIADPYTQPRPSPWVLRRSPLRIASVTRNLVFGLKVLQNTLHIASYDGLRPNTVQDLPTWTFVLDTATDTQIRFARNGVGTLDA